MTDPANVHVTLIQLGESQQKEVPEGTTIGQLVDQAIEDAAAVDVKTEDGGDARKQSDRPVRDGETITAAPKQVKHGL